MSTNRTRIAFLGASQPAERWRAAFEQAGVSFAPEAGAAEADADALVVAPGAQDPFSRAKGALAAGTPVLYATPFLVSPWQAALLDALSRRRACLLRIAEPFQHQGGFRFLRRLTRGREPLWRLRYLRTTSLAEDGRIDELAVEDLAVCQALVDVSPLTVTATAAQRDDMNDVCAAFLTVRYPNGAVAQCTISLAEAQTARELVAVTPSRSVALDRSDPDAPLQIAAHSGAHASGYLAKRTIAMPAADPVVEEARRFVEALTSADRAFGNGERWARVAALWWAARHSMSFGGAVEVPAPAVSLSPQTEPPPLRVIEGGGRTARAAKRPPLTLIAS